MNLLLFILNLDKDCLFILTVCIEIEIWNLIPRFLVSDLDLSYTVSGIPFPTSINPFLYRVYLSLYIEIVFNLGALIKFILLLRFPPGKNDQIVIHRE